MNYPNRLTEQSMPTPGSRCPFGGTRASAAAAWLVILAVAPFARADQVVSDGINHAGAKILGLEQGRLQFRDATGVVHAAWLSDVGLIVVDRGGIFSDFNQAERFMAGNEAERAVVRYRRTMAIAEDFWPDLINARLAVAYDRTGQLDQAVLNVIQLLRGKRTGPGLAARLLPSFIPSQREAAVVRAIESLDAALSRPIDDAGRTLLQLLRYEILRRIGDHLAASLAGEVASLDIPEPTRSRQAYQIQLSALKHMAEAEGGPASKLRADLDQAIRTCPDAVLPSFLLLKGDVLLRSAVTREETIETAWPFLRVAIHFPDDARAAEGLYGAATAVERLGRTDQAADLLKECLAHKRTRDEVRASADAAMRRLRSDRQTTTPAIGASDATIPAPDGTESPAEEFRLSPTVFREGLKKRGLMELLERHVQRFPPVSATESMLLMRELRLAEFADKTRPREHRRAAIGEANQLLEQLIQQNPDDPRRFEWRYALANSLLYEEGEPFATNLLFRGESAKDRAELARRTGRAVAALTTLEGDVTHEYERLDKLPVAEFETLEATGHVERIDNLQPRIGYLMLWALFYDAVSRDEVDAMQAKELMDILERLSLNRAVLTTPHEQSHVQIQGLLLGGMTLRRLNRFPEARELLDRAIHVGAQVADAAERRAVQWAITLAWIERIRDDVSDDRFDEAATGLTRLRALIDADLAGDFDAQIVAALLERSVLRARASAADEAGKTADARKYRRESWGRLAELARESPERRDDVNAAVSAALGDHVDESALDPFEQSALVAGLLDDASRDASAAQPLLERAVEVGRRFLDRQGAEAPALVPEVLYNAGVAEYRRGRTGEAAELFLRIATDHPTFERASQAAAYAVQLGAENFGDAARRQQPAVKRLYRDALETLLARYGGSEPARYWRFHYAFLLEESADYDEAARQYALVDPSHEHYDRSLFSRSRCLAMSVDTIARKVGAEYLSVGPRLDEFFSAQRAFEALARKTIEAGADAEAAATLTRLLAMLRILTAEVQLQPMANQTAAALETLASFEREFPAAADLMGRVWRVRLQAYERLGRLEEAARAIPDYVVADPTHAGATLQSLYTALSEEAERDRAGGDERETQRKTEMALVLAQQLHDWVLRNDEAFHQFNRHDIEVQLAEANLRAGRYEPATELFDRLRCNENGSAATSSPQADPRVVAGYAESLFRTGAYEKALPEFNRLAMTLPAGDGRRWLSLLRDLQCRTALNHPPDGIIKVIEQQRFLHPDLGGAEFSPQFDKLQRENERRRALRP